jgi:hypothetical protein
MSCNKHTILIFYAIATFVLVCIFIDNVTLQTMTPLFEWNYAQLTRNDTQTVLEEIQEIQEPTLLVYIRTAPDEFVDRRKLRKLWIADIQKLVVARILFLVGLSTNETINEELIKERNTEHDLLVFNFTDAYRMLSLKMFYSLHWHMENVVNPDNMTVIWTNIDGYLNATNLMEYIRINNIAQQHGAIHGGCTCTGICTGLGGQPVQRDVT